MNLLDALAWRYATKKFDAAKTIREEDLQFLQESIRLAPTSYGLQPFRVFVVTDPGIRERLKAVAYGQPQLTDASHIFVFAHRLDMPAAYIDDFMALTAKVREMDPAALTGYAAMIKGSIAHRSPAEITAWNQRQAYIALGHLLIAAASRHLDACPMEGFDPAGVEEVLGLREQGLGAAVIAAVGYRSAEDKMQHAARVRLSPEALFQAV